MKPQCVVRCSTITVWKSAQALGALAGKIWRIGLMGFASNEKNVLNCLGALDAVLSGMNAQINSGAAVRAAKQAFAQ